VTTNVRVFSSACDRSTNQSSIGLVLDAIQAAGLEDRLDVWMNVDVGFPLDWTTVANSIGLVSYQKKAHPQLRAVIMGEK
jgi:uncharacterized protein YidB (DUF937 family)